MPWIDWPLSCGLGGQHHVYWPAIIAWIRWPSSRGLGGHFPWNSQFAKMDAFKAQTQLLSGYYGLIPFGEMSGAGLLSEASDLTGVYF